jgi:hypothetical protein
MFYLEDLAAGLCDEDDETCETPEYTADVDDLETDPDAPETLLVADDSQAPPEFALDDMGETLAKALLEAQDELLERELEEALAEERASDALEADEDDEDDESDADDELSEWEELEVEVEGGGAANSTRRVKGRHGRLANKVRTLRRAVEMRREAQGDDGLRPVTSRSARQASLFLFPYAWAIRLTSCFIHRRRAAPARWAEERAAEKAAVKEARVGVSRINASARSSSSRSPPRLPRRSPRLSSPR